MVETIYSIRCAAAFPNELKQFKSVINFLHHKNFVWQMLYLFQLLWIWMCTVLLYVVQSGNNELILFTFITLCVWVYSMFKCMEFMRWKSYSFSRFVSSTHIWEFLREKPKMWSYFWSSTTTKIDRSKSISTHSSDFI